MASNEAQNGTGPDLLAERLKSSVWMSRTKKLYELLDEMSQIEAAPFLQLLILARFGSQSDSGEYFDPN